MTGFQLFEQFQRGRFVRKQVETCGRIFRHFDGAVMDAILNPVRRDVESARELRHRQTSRNTAWM